MPSQDDIVVGACCNNRIHNRTFNIFNITLATGFERGRRNFRIVTGDKSHSCINDDGENSSPTGHTNIRQSHDWLVTSITKGILVLQITTMNASRM